MARSPWVVIFDTQLALNRGLACSIVNHFGLAIGDRALMPAVDLSQYLFQVLSDRLGAFVGVLNFDGVDGYRVAEIGLTG
jgi:hypothetical protein